jgi:hypothetical protein
MRHPKKDLLGKKKAVAALDACEYVYIQLLLLPQQIALYIEKHSSLIKEEAATAQIMHQGGIYRFLMTAAAYSCVLALPPRSPVMVCRA